EERNEEVFQEEKEESAGINLAEIVASGPDVCKTLSKASKDQRPTTVQISKFSGTSQKGVGTKSYTFDISQAELIFDQLLKEKMIKLPNGHDIPSANELRNKTFCKWHNKAAMGVDQNPFPNAQANMVNVNFPRPDQPRPRLDLGGSGKAAAERRARETHADPKAKGKAKMYPEMTKASDEKIPSREEPPKAIVLCSRCQCEVSLEVVPPKAKEPSRDLTRE
ncbi:unnamed protein product, partial [Prunus brigantina]